MKKRQLEFLKKSLGIFLFSVIEDGGGEGGEQPTEQTKMPTQEELLAELEGEKPTGTESEEGGTSSPDESGEGNASPELDGYLKNFKKIMGDDYQLPEEIIKGVDKDGKEIDDSYRFNYLAQEIAKASQPNDPYVNAYLAAKAEGKGQEFINKTSELTGTLNLDDKAFYKTWLMARKGVSEQNPNGVSEEEIDKHIESINAIDLPEKVAPLREMYKQSIDQFFNNQVQQREAINQKQIEQINADNLNLINPYIERVNKEGLVLPFTDEMKEDYVKAIPSLITKNNQGQNAIDMFLSKDENILKMLPYIHMVMQGKEASFFTALKEGQKQNALGKIFPPDEHAGNAAAGSNKLDINKLLADDIQ